MTKTQKHLSEEEAKRLELEITDGPSITSKTSITHYKTANFSLNKEPKKEDSKP